MLSQPTSAFASLRRGRRLPLQHLEIISAQSALPAVKFSVVATPNPSLIERKERWARKMAGKIRAHQGESSTGPAVRAGQADFQAGSRRSTDRLPPGQHLTQGFPILDLGIKPEIALADWRLEIGGLVENPKTFTWEEFNALPQFEDVSDFHCVTTWSKFDCRWRGVAFFTLAEIVKPKPEVRHVLFSSYDGYTTNVRIEDALDDDALVADPVRRQTDPARSWRSCARDYSETLRLERREVRARDSISRRRSAWVLGSPRLQQYRRSVDGGQVLESR